ncbi:MAG: hypothetical protein HEP71_06430 [Roseivirga sp.]|nr:hypothetical protein [Roseivirga sp.]
MRIQSFLLRLCWIALVMLSIHPAKAQKVNPRVHKLWDPAVPLSWSDFKGLPDSLLITGKGHSDAGIHTMIIVDYCCEEEGRADICFQSAIHRTKSWSVSDSESLLVHEQLHFDITELITRKIRRAISRSSATTANEKYRVYLSSVREFSRMQIRYDRETDHGLRPVRQLKWKEKVWRELEELKAFAENSDCR